MIALSDELVERIAEDLRRKGIETQDLHDNLLDHICCILEGELTQLSEFDEKYPEILRRFYKDKLVELEEETQQLLTFKNYYAMKKTMLISGSITSICFMLGAVAKYFHLPGAGAMIVAAIVVFSFLFLPVMITLKLKESPENRHKAVLILGLITGILGSMSVLFKLMWWPGANVLWMTSLVSLLLLFLPAYFFTGFRNPVLKTNTIVTTILLLAGGAMMFSLTSLTTSNSSSIAIDNMEVLLSANLQQLNERNEALLKAIASLPVANDAITALPELTSTRAMLAYLQNMRAGLISKIENMPLEKAMKTRVNELPNSKNWSQVKSILTNVPELSQKTLIENVNKYNQSIAGNRSLCPLVISNNDFRNTQLHYVIHVLNQLSCQAETNRQAILTYHLGKFQNHI